MKYTKLCHECGDKHPQYLPIKYTLGQCDICYRYLGVAEVELRNELPKEFKDIFGDLNNKPKK